MSTYPRLSTTREVAEWLSLSPRTLERCRVTGEGPRYRKVERRVRYTPEDLVLWLDGWAQRSTQDPGALTGPNPRDRSCPTPDLDRVLGQAAVPARSVGSNAT